MTDSGRSPQAWDGLDQLASRAREAQTERELFFLIANETFALVPYRSALVFDLQGGKPRLACASGLTEVDRGSPYGAWCEKVLAHWLPLLAQRKRFSASDLPTDLALVWTEYWPAVVHVHVLPGRSGAVTGAVIYVSDNPWPEPADSLLSALHQVHGLCLEQMRTRADLGARLKKLLLGGTERARRQRLWLLGALLLLLCLPVRQFVIAPAEIISLDSMAVTTPVEGTVAEMVARPNQLVRQGDVLVRLDDTAIRNRLESARQALEVARAEYLAGAHRALVSVENAAEAGVLKGRIHERLAEVAYLEDQFAMLEVKAARDGIAVYGQENDWIGKPVSAGQRIMELADATKVGVQVWVPVADAINMAVGQALPVLLYADPLNPLQAHIEQTGYQPTKSPDGVVAYRVRATLPPEQSVRLGLRGSAKINGGWVPLVYLLLRRPFHTARQWLGV